MTLTELRQKADSLCVQYPEKATKGQLQKLIRDGTRAPDEEIVSFGRYKNFMYKELPEGYLTWAIRETEASCAAANRRRRQAAAAECRSAGF